MTNKRYIDTMDFRFGRIKGLLLLLFSIFTTISLYSYNSFDSCMNVESTTRIANAAGKYGAFIADITLQSLGYGSYLLNLILYYLSCILLIKKHITKFALKITICTVSIILTSMFIGCIGYRYNFQSSILPGGYIGFAIYKKFASFDWLTKFTIYFSLLSLALLTIYEAFDLHILYKLFVKDKKKPRKPKFHNRILELLVKFLSSLLQLPILCIKYLKIKYKLYKVSRNIKKQSHDMAKVNNPEKVVPITSHNNNVTQLIDKKTSIYIAPSVNLLTDIDHSFIIPHESVIKAQIVKLSKILSDFGVRGEITGFKAGPVVSLFEFSLEPGIKSSRVVSLCDDIARMMIVSSVRIATIPNKDKLGIEMPNKDRSIVSFKKLLNHPEYQNSTLHIPMILGCDIFGQPVIQDLTYMPHLLIAGTTGSGKSVGVNGMILSMLFKLSPQKCKFIMIDPKMLEFSLYNDIPHLLMPVITDPKGAVTALKWAVREMENRYYKMSNIGVRNIYGYNEKIANGELPEDHTELPFIVVIIDEMADLMVVAGKEVEVLVQRLSQMARAAGIHLIMATQRPSVDIITGVIKANFPTRISYQVTSKIDSRTILGEQGAEQLLGKGDMLYMITGVKIRRIHGPFVADSDVEKVVNDLKSKYQPSYIDIFTQSTDNEDSVTNLSNDLNSNSGDLYQQAVQIVMEEKKTSISYLQRKLRIGYNKAATLIEQMERDGILTEADHTGKRSLMHDE